MLSDDIATLAATLSKYRKTGLDLGPAEIEGMADLTRDWAAAASRLELGAILARAANDRADTVTLPILGTVR